MGWHLSHSVTEACGTQRPRRLRRTLPVPPSPQPPRRVPRPRAPTTPLRTDKISPKRLLLAAGGSGLSPSPCAARRLHSQLSIYRRGRAKHATRAHAARLVPWPLRHHRPPSRPRGIHHDALPFAPSDADCTHATRAARTAPPPLPLPPECQWHAPRAGRPPRAARAFLRPPFPSSHRYRSRAGPLTRAASARTGRQGAATATAGPCAGA